ncbi:ZN254 protein, partial [Anthoscopus minutus]|nr:ZN254 protein [Anthoscopus minutus]
QDGGRSFIWSSGLVVNKQLYIHEKHYRCLECGKSFSDNSNLIIQQCLHTGEQP